MEIKSGYKQTEVGVIPEDWNPTTISEIATKVGSGITPRGGSNNYKHYGRPFVRSQNVGWGTLQLSDLVYIDDETHHSFSATELKKGDVLLNITGASIGRSAIADDRLAGGNVNQHVCIIRTEADKISSFLINYLLLSNLGQRQIDSFQAGGNREGLNFGQIRSIKLPLPPTKVEQETIADALSDADALIESLEQLTAKKRQIKQGTMQELLTGKRRLPGFEKKPGYKQTEVGVIPEDWTINTIQDLIDRNAIVGHLDGNHGALYPRSHEFKESGVPYITANDLCGHKVSYENCKYLSEERARRFLKGIAKNGDVLFAHNATVGPTAMLSTELDYVILSTTATYFRCNSEKLVNSFLLYVLQSPFFVRQYRSVMAQSTRNQVPITAQRKLSVALPSTKAEQEAIATILGDMDAEIDSLETKLTKARQVKQGMMQELLTGRVRLI